MGVNMSYRIFVSKWVPMYVIAVLLLAALPFVAQTPTETVLPFPTVHFQLCGKLISTTEKLMPRCSTEGLR